MTEQEKYIMVRTSCHLANWCDDNDYQAQMLVEWCIHNDIYKSLNREFRHLIEESKNGTPVDDKIQENFEKRMEEQTTTMRIEKQLKIPEEFNKKNEKENYILTQMISILFRTGAFDSQLNPSSCRELTAILNWSTSKQRIKELNKELNNLYRTGQKNGFNTTADKFNLLQKEKAACSKKVESAVEILISIAHENNIKDENIPFLSDRNRSTKRKKAPK